MFGFGEDAGRFRAYLAEGHLIKVPLGNSCFVMEIPRYLPWTGAAAALAAAGGWAVWRWLEGRSEDESPKEAAGRAGARPTARGSSSAARGREGASPRVSRRSRGASSTRSPSVRTRRR